jgi:hypothetical protein
VFSWPIVPSCVRQGRQTSRFVTDSAVSAFGYIRVRGGGRRRCRAAPKPAEG